MSSNTVVPIQCLPVIFTARWGSVWSGNTFSTANAKQNEGF